MKQRGWRGLAGAGGGQAGVTQVELVSDGDEEDVVVEWHPRLELPSHQDPGSDPGHCEAHLLQDSAEELGLLVAMSSVLGHGGQEAVKGEVGHISPTVQVYVLVGEPGEVLPV